jgi:hypothetical protein
MIRSADSSTLVTYHPPRETRATSAKMLHSRIYYAGASLYWRKLYAEAKDPTFILVMMLWHALYAWDQALEALYQHISTLVRGIVPILMCDNRSYLAFFRK